MSYRLIDSNVIAEKYPEVNDMPCVFADLPNGLDGSFITQEWIPCSERLPKDNKTKIVQIKGINEVEAGYYSNGDWWCINSAGALSICEVVAWMDLPEPYRGEE